MESVTKARWRIILKRVVLIAASVGVLHLVAVILLRWVDVPVSAFMLRSLFSGEGLHYHWIAWDRISPNIAIAVIASEDQRFPTHSGFDFNSIAEAIERNEKRKRPLGASTISQQTAKNLFLWSGRSWIRKGLEAYATIVIEACWPKRRILEVYLNIAEFGPGIYGVSEAARLLFKTDAGRVTLYEASLLAAALPNPRQRRADRPTAYLRHRAAEIREQVALLGGGAYLATLK